MNLDRVIAVRTNKTVYRDGDKCIKVFDSDYSKADVLNEALNHARVEETALNVPTLYGVGMTEEQARQLLSENKNEKTEFFREIGVSNVHKRLQYEFGEDYGLRVESRLSEFTTVSVLLPFAPQEDIG